MYTVQSIKHPTYTIRIAYQTHFDQLHRVSNILLYITSGAGQTTPPELFAWTLRGQNLAAYGGSGAKASQERKRGGWNRTLEMFG